MYIQCTFSYAFHVRVLKKTLQKHATCIMLILLTCIFFGVGTVGTQGRGTLALHSGWHRERQSRGREGGRECVQRQKGGSKSPPLHFRQFLPNLIFLLHYTREHRISCAFAVSKYTMYKMNTTTHTHGSLTTWQVSILISVLVKNVWFWDIRRICICTRTCTYWTM